MTLNRDRVTLVAATPQVDGITGQSGGNSLMHIRKSSTGSNEVAGGGDLFVWGHSRLVFARPNEVVNVGSIKVMSSSALDLRDGVSVTATGDLDIFRAEFSMARAHRSALGGISTRSRAAWSSTVPSTSPATWATKRLPISSSVPAPL